MISHKSRVAPCYEIIISWFYFMLMLTHITNCNSWRAMENCLEVMRCGIMCCEQTGECGQHNLHNTLTLFTLTSSSGNWIILENGDFGINVTRHLNINDNTWQFSRQISLLCSACFAHSPHHFAQDIKGEFHLNQMFDIREFSVHMSPNISLPGESSKQTQLSR